MTRIGDDTVSRFAHGCRSAIGTSAAPLTTQAYHAARGVQLRAAATNTAAVYVGRSDVTAGGSDATCGYPLEANEGLFLPLSDPRQIHLIAASAGQSIYWLVL